MTECGLTQIVGCFLLASAAGPALGRARGHGAGPRLPGAPRWARREEEGEGGHWGCVKARSCAVIVRYTCYKCSGTCKITINEHFDL